MLVSVTITDRHNPHEPVTHLVGESIDCYGRHVTKARVTSPHPVWNGAEVCAGCGIVIASLYGPVGGGSDSDEGRRLAKQLLKNWSVVKYDPPVKCAGCGCKAEWASIDKPYDCLECRQAKRNEILALARRRRS